MLFALYSPFQLRETEAEQEAQELTANESGATPTRQTDDLSDSAVEVRSIIS